MGNTINKIRLKREICLAILLLIIGRDEIHSSELRRKNNVILHLSFDCSFVW